MTRTIRVHELGGPEVLRIEEFEVGAPGPGEVRIRVSAVGLNRSEAMYRAGRYPTKPQLPSLIGYEGVGTIEALGPGVEGFAVGERVCVLPMISQGQYGIWAEQAIDTEPAQLASWIAAMPTLEEAARMMTPSSMPTFATSMIA